MFERFTTLCGVLAVLCLAASAQVVPTGFIAINASRLLDGSGVPVASATVCAQAVVSGAAQSVGVGGGGVTTTPPVCAQATNGAWTLSLPDGAYSSPLNATFVVTATDNVSGLPLLSGYGKVQPHSKTCTASGSGVTCVANAGGDWCSLDGCNFDLLRPNAPANALYVQGIKGDKGDTGVSTANGSSGGYNVPGLLTTNFPYGVSPQNAVLYNAGSSIDAGYLASSGVYATGGYDQAPGLLLFQGPWAAGHGDTYYNDAVPGSTSPQSFARYSTGTNALGVIVPSAHSVSPAQTCATWVTNPAACPVAFYFLGATTLVNDSNHGVALADAIAGLQSEAAAAHADGYIVVALLPSSILTNGGNADYIFSGAQAIRNHTVYSDILVDEMGLLPDQMDPLFYQADRVHYTVLGNQVKAAHLAACLRAGGCADNNAGERRVRGVLLSASGTIAPGTEAAFVVCSPCTITLPATTTDYVSLDIVNASGGTVTIAAATGWGINPVGQTAVVSTRALAAKSTLHLRAYHDGSAMNWFIAEPANHTRAQCQLGGTGTAIPPECEVVWIIPNDGSQTYTLPVPTEASRHLTIINYQAPGFTAHPFTIAPPSGADMCTPLSCATGTGNTVTIPAYHSRTFDSIAGSGQVWTLED